ncbi:hypothetical protein THIAE_09675 [Thiomicrospira aerophila AL3]|uniref:HigA2-like helix-turn-helix domain-containing protein n=1 Tax=Thiomicrospira aerophila AL3 TaxID=717772 RepID=W0DZW6_9GAMM|nr:hypothetical protein [Thiomicrospira aerophila]AHF02396.1 hypothetical protein THIAE_09675 [Thiomicrospira aerophila AL3]
MSNMTLMRTKNTRAARLGAVILIIKKLTNASDQEMARLIDCNIWQLRQLELGRSLDWIKAGRKLSEVFSQLGLQPIESVDQEPMAYPNLEKYFDMLK